MSVSIPDHNFSSLDEGALVSKVNQLKMKPSLESTASYDTASFETPQQDDFPLPNGDNISDDVRAINSAQKDDHSSSDISEDSSFSFDSTESNVRYRPADGYATDPVPPSSSSSAVNTATRLMIPESRSESSINFSKPISISPPRPAMTTNPNSSDSLAEQLSPSPSVGNINGGLRAGGATAGNTTTTSITAPPQAVTASTSNPNLSNIAGGSRISPSHSYYGLQQPYNHINHGNGPLPHHNGHRSQQSIDSIAAKGSNGLYTVSSAGSNLQRPASAGAGSSMGPRLRPRDSRLNIRPMSSRSSFMSANDHANNSNGDSPILHTSTPPFAASHSRRTSMASFTLNETATQYASASMFDLSQSSLTPHFGEDAKSSLMPRIKTIEQYRKNAKKSNDPVIQFQFAQYMLQTALLSGTTTSKPPGDQDSTSDSASSLSLANGASNKPNAASLGIKSSSKKSLGDRLPGAEHISEEEKRIKADLLKEAITNLRKLADRGFPEAQYLLGDAYASGALGKPDLKESFALFQLAAKHGHGEASYRAALCLEEGWGCSKDIKRAVQFLRTASSRSQPGAMLRLGLACFYGKMGFPNNSKVKQEGVKWLTRAADSANEVYPQGPYELAKIYEMGYKDIVFVDIQYAVQLYARSAELHFIPAATKLGNAYEYGSLGCPQDAALSIHYYTIAAMGGDPQAMLAMCAWYMVGAEPVLPRNPEEAYEWAIRAAQRGLPKAQFAVGYFMENGIGVDRDIAQSSFWYNKAAASGDEKAIERLRKSSKDSNASSSTGSKKGSDKDCIIC